MSWSFLPSPPGERLTAEFTEDHRMVLTPEQVGATETRNSGIIGEEVDLNLVHTGEVRPSQIVYELTSHLVMHKYRKPGEAPPYHLFGQLRRIAKEWLDNWMECKGGTYKSQLKYKTLADGACDRIVAAINAAGDGNQAITAMIDPYNPVGSTANVRFNTSNTDRWQPRADRCHLNWIILDSDWEGEFCRVVESHPKVRAYVKNHNLGLEVPYRSEGESHLYRPDCVNCVELTENPEIPFWGKNAILCFSPNHANGLLDLCFSHLIHISTVTADPSKARLGTSTRSSVPSKRSE